MSPEIMSAVLSRESIPQVWPARYAKMNTCSFSLWLRHMAVISEEKQVELAIAVQAMCAVADGFGVPIDWRRGEQMRPLVEAKMAEFRRARSAELAREFRESCSSGNSAQENV